MGWLLGSQAPHNPGKWWFGGSLPACLPAIDALLRPLHRRQNDTGLPGPAHLSRLPR